MEGTILGDRYELIEKVGEGGMATVYKARCRILDRIVAVKVLKEEFSKDKNFVEKFKIEALAAARISHPNIVNIYDVGQQDDIHYIVMEFVDGQTLKDIIDQQAPIPVSNAVDIAIMICDGVHHAHEKGIIHRDIKPHNILITENGIVKVADFGIARAITSATITFAGNMVGSVHYISPEQARGEPVSRPTDIYSIGCVLYEMVTGQVPFDAESPITVALKHVHDEPAPPRAINDKVPAALEGIIIRAMEKVPGHRFATAEEMRNALINFHNNTFANYGNRSDKTLIMAPVTGGRDKDPMKKKKLRPTGIALIVIAILGLLSGLFMMGGNLFGSEVVVPDVENIDVAQAAQKLKDEGLVMKRIADQNDDRVEKGRVISQEPGKGEKVKKGREVKVIISKGPELIKVPNLIGYDINEAEIILRNKGFKLGKPDEIFDEKHPEGQIISQNPDSGDRAAEGSRVKVVVSKGKELSRIAMPNLVGDTLTEAEKKLKDNKLNRGDVKRQASTRYSEDQVISQDTDAGVMVEENTTINLVVSSGPGPVAQTQAVEFMLPAQKDFYKVVIKVKDSHGEREVYNQEHQASDNVYVMVSYFGTGTAEVYLNGIYYKTFRL